MDAGTRHITSDQLDWWHNQRMQTKKCYSKHGRVPKRQIVFRWKWCFSMDEIKSLNQVGLCLAHTFCVCTLLFIPCGPSGEWPPLRVRTKKKSHKNMLPSFIFWMEIVRIKTVHISNVLRLCIWWKRCLRRRRQYLTAFLCASQPPSPFIIGAILLDR